VTLPSINWCLFCGVILCSARVMGEFGSLIVVSGRIRGQINTMPLHVGIRYSEYQSVAAFAVASLLALVTLAIKSVAEWRMERERDILPTLGHPHAVALRSVRCDQLTGGLAPPRVRPLPGAPKKSPRFAARA